MSQWGAEAMAQRGADYRQILATFFPGTTLRRTAER
jgi:SpoIID/LytB domain protein